MAKRVFAHEQTQAVVSHVVEEMGLNREFVGGERVDRGVSIVEISISCKDLPDLDRLTKSDPMCVLYTMEFEADMWKEVGRTELIWNNLNPVFVKKLVIEYFFEESQYLKFEVYHMSDTKNKSELKRQKLMGVVECTLGEIVSSHDPVVKPLQDTPGNNRKQSEMILTAEELGMCKEKIKLKFAGKNLDKKDIFGKSDPFLRFYRTHEKNSILVHKTECKKLTLNPEWDSFEIPLRAFCNGDYHRVIKVECLDYNKSGNHTLIGTFETTVERLNMGRSKNKYECINEELKKKKKKSYKNSGVIELVDCKITPVHSFLDYVKGGCEIHCHVAIDFTSSNGKPTDPSSLHYIQPGKPNVYEDAIEAVVDILEKYDSDKMFPAYGFGAKVPPEGKVSHDFFLRFDSDDPDCKGVHGIMDAYRKALDVVIPDGPTNFAPVVQRVASEAKGHVKGGNDYHILLIITDGVIQDMSATTEAIVNAACLPLSIIIVGVGEENFEKMNILDGDDVRLATNTKVAERDIVQFVPLNKYIDKDASGNSSKTKARLAKEVLFEIPDQFLSFMDKHNFTPRPPIQKGKAAAAKDAPPPYKEVGSKKGQKQKNVRF